MFGVLLLAYFYGFELNLLPLSQTTKKKQKKYKKHSRACGTEK